MKQRGRKSLASAGLAKARSADSLAPLSPPEYLDDREACEWREIVDCMGSGHFPRETEPLLAHLCTVVVSLRDVSAALREFGPGVPSGASWKRYRDLIKMRTALAAQLVSFSTKLRVTKTSRDVRGSLTARYERFGAQPSPRPWDDHALPQPQQKRRRAQGR